MRRPGIKPGSRPWQGRILSLYYRRPVFVLGFEPRISRVLGERHNQARPYEQASNEDRTRDLALTKRMLCQLSYRGERRACRVCRLFDFLFLSKKQNSETGNRTPGICVTGRDVTNYTISDWSIWVSIPVPRAC